MQDPSKHWPDHDPANSSFPPGPLRPLVPMDRAAELAVDAYQRGARDMALRVLRALDRDLGPETIGTLRPLEYHGADYVSAVLRSLDDLVADQ